MLEPVERGRAWCDHCSKTVVRAGELTERELRTLLATHAGETSCIEYDSRPDGTVLLRPEEPARRPWLVAAFAGLAACTGYGEVSPTTWPDPEPSRPFDRPRMPDDEVLVAAADGDDGVDTEAPISNAEGEAAAAVAEASVTHERSDAPAPAETRLGCPRPREASPSYTEPVRMRGAMVVVTHDRGSSRSDRLAYRPTRELWREFAARVRARRAARLAR